MQTVSTAKLCPRNWTGDRGVHSNCRSRIAAAFLAVVSLPASAAILHVSTISPSPTPPYADWATAAHTIQDAVDAAQTGDTMLVNDGVYDTGGRALADLTFNRVAIDKAITVRSVNGPEVTVITGGGTGRCAYVGGTAVLSGFTLTDGIAFHGGGIQSEPSGFVGNCVIIGNSADNGGGGASGGTLCNCMISGNGALRQGGGAYSTILYNCNLTHNGSGDNGGGVAQCTLYNCTLTGNKATYGGGASGGSLYNCALIKNLAGSDGGGAVGSTLYNCTLTGNSANFGSGGGVAFSATVYNCIIYYNLAGNPYGRGQNYDEYSSLSYSCTTPLPSSGVGNTTQEPGFVDLAGGDYHLLLGSKCINAGNNQDWMIGATDLDGNPRISWGTVDMGAYEFLVPASGPWTSHGKYVSAVARVGVEFVARGLITEAQKDAFVSAAANSDVGKPK